MDPKQTTKAPASPAAPLIKCKVRPNNRYAGKAAGEIIEVSEREYATVTHALISLADEAAQAAEEQTAASQPPPGQQLFRALRTSARAAARAAEDARSVRRAKELQAMGVQIAAKG